MELSVFACLLLTVILKLFSCCWGETSEIPPTFGPTSTPTECLDGDRQAERGCIGYECHERKWVHYFIVNEECCILAPDQYGCKELLQTTTPLYTTPLHTTTDSSSEPRSSIIPIITRGEVRRKVSVSDQTYTSSTLCSRGRDQTSYYDASCKEKTTNSTEVSLIAVTKVLYGAKPTSRQCALNGSLSECCYYVEGEDCLNDDVIPSTLVEDCSGAKSCQARGRRLATDSVCAFPKLFDGDTTYSMFEYQCVNIGLVENICHEGVLHQGKQWYLDSNIHHINKQQDGNCSCQISTTCGSHVVFEAVDVRLARTSSGCGEIIFFSDVKIPQHNHSVTCWDKHLQMKLLFESHSNIASINMNILGDDHLGKVWIRVTSSSTNATIRLHCGLTTDEPIIPEHLCEEDKTTSTPTLTTPTTVTTPPDDIGTGAIVGIVIAGFVIVAVLVIILILLFRRHNHKENVYTHSYRSHHENDEYSRPNPTDRSQHENDEYSSITDEIRIQPDGAFINPSFERDTRRSDDVLPQVTDLASSIHDYAEILEDDEYAKPVVEQLFEN